jgi:hypothetical protein
MGKTFRHSHQATVFKGRGKGTGRGAGAGVGVDSGRGLGLGLGAGAGVDSDSDSAESTRRFKGTDRKRTGRQTLRPSPVEAFDPKKPTAFARTPKDIKGRAVMGAYKARFYHNTRLCKGALEASEFDQGRQDHEERAFIDGLIEIRDTEVCEKKLPVWIQRCVGGSCECENCRPDEI